VHVRKQPLFGDIQVLPAQLQVIMPEELRDESTCSRWGDFVYSHVQCSSREMMDVSIRQLSMNNLST
jgi:hypothetical protein